MTSTKPSVRLEGIIPPLVTPLLDHASLDHEGLDRLIGRVLDAGIQSLFVLGTTGEGPSLRYALRHELVEVACEMVNGRSEVLVGVTDTSADESLELAQAAAEAGATAVVLAPPYYWPMSQVELVRYCLWFAERSPLPVVLYNMPACCKTWFEPESIRELMQHEEIVGLKDSCGDLDHLQKCLDCRSPDQPFPILVGPEELLLPAMQMGASGGVHGGANMFPDLYLRLYQSIRDDDLETARDLHETVLQVSQAIYSLDDTASRVVRGTKATLEMMGICSGYVAPPFCEVSSRQLQTLRRSLEKLASRLGNELTAALTTPGN